MLTAQTLAMRLQGREYRAEMTKAEEAEAKAAGLVVVFGASDDLMEFRGAIDEEVGAYEGTTVALTDKGLCKNECESEDCPAHIAAVEAARKIEAKWCPDIGISWAYATDIPHFIFEVMEDDEVYCQGIVFALADAAAEANEPAKWIDDPHDIEQGRMLNAAWLKVHGLTAAEAIKPTQAEPGERKDQFAGAGNMVTDAQARGALYCRLHTLSKLLESSGRIDEMEHRDAYPAILDAMAAIAAQPTQAEAPSDEDVWRDLALQFDGHRMQALGWLKLIARELPQTPAWVGLRHFLASPPLSGEAVLAERIAALATQQAVQGEPRRHAAGCPCGSCITPGSKTWSNIPQGAARSRSGDGNA